MTAPTTLIAGAGPGGLTLARALQVAGLPFRVLEPRLPGVVPGAHGSRNNIALLLQEAAGVLDNAGLDIAAYPTFVRGGTRFSAVAVGRLERDLLAVLLDGGGDVVLGARAVAVGWNDAAGVRVGVEGARFGAFTWLETAQFANFTGARTGFEAQLGMGLREVTPPRAYASGSWGPDGSSAARKVAEPANNRRPQAFGFSSPLDGVYMVINDASGRGQGELAEAARSAGVTTAMRGPALPFESRDAIVDVASAGSVLAGGESVGQHNFRLARGANLAIEDAASMAQAIIDVSSAGTSAAARAQRFDAYGVGAIARHQRQVEAALRLEAH